MVDEMTEPAPQPEGEPRGPSAPIRILVAIDPMRVRVAAVEAAARLARSLGAGLAGLVLQAERMFAEVSHRFGLDWSVLVEQGAFPRRAFELAGAGDLVFVDRAPRFAPGAPGYRQIATLYDGSVAAARALRTAAGLAQSAGLKLRIVLAADDADAAVTLRRAALAIIEQANRQAAPGTEAGQAGLRGAGGHAPSAGPRGGLRARARAVAPAPRVGRAAPLAEFVTIGAAQARDPARLYAALHDGETTLLLLPAPEPARAAEVIAVCDAVRCSLVVLR